MFRYFHLCSHESINTTQREREVITFVKNSGKDIDSLIKGASVIEIVEIRAMTYTPRKTSIQLEYDTNLEKDRYDNEVEEHGHYDHPQYYYQDYSLHFDEGMDKSNPLPTSYYTLYLKNGIKWNVEPPLTYEVKMLVRYDEGYRQIFNPAECDICQGKGWYVDILNNSAAFEVDTGIVKIIQRFIKDILTEIATNVLELSYGTIIRRTVANVPTNDEELFDDIRLIVSEVESTYLQRQALEYDKLTPEERLVSGVAENVFRSPLDKRRIVLELSIVTEAENRNFRLSL